MKRTMMILMSLSLVAQGQVLTQSKANLTSSKILPIRPLSQGDQVKKSLNFEISPVSQQSDFKNSVSEADIKAALRELKILKRDGNVNSGGGNFLVGKLIQKYRKDVTDLAGYNKGAKPLLTKLAQMYPELSKLIDERMQMLSFYIIPANLVELAEEYTGLPFASQQYAVQKVGEKLSHGAEVFIVEDAYYKKFSTQEQGEVLLHETIESLFITPIDAEALRATRAWDSETKIQERINKRSRDMKAVRDIFHYLVNMNKYSREKLKELIIASAGDLFGRVKAINCTDNSSNKVTNKNEIRCFPDYRQGEVLLKDSSLFMTPEERSQFENDVRKRWAMEKTKRESEEKLKQDSRAQIEVHTAKLKIDFEKIKTEYRETMNDLLSRLGRTCQAVRERRKFNPKEQNFEALTPVEKSNRYQEIYSEWYYFSEKLLGLEYQSGLKSHSYYLNLGVSSNMLNEPLIFGPLQILIMNSVSVTEYPISIENWTGEQRELNDSLRSGLKNFRFTSRGMFDRPAFRRLDLNSASDLEYLEYQVRDLKQFCETLPAIKSSLRDIAEGKFDFEKVFRMLYPKELRNFLNFDLNDGIK
jgi:guanylate kinase